MVPCRYHTLAAWRDTPNVRATSAWVAPQANMRAASSRRCCRPARSRLQAPVLICIAAASAWTSRVAASLP
jgi:hypothetical protein